MLQSYTKSRGANRQVAGIKEIAQLDKIEPILQKYNYFENIF
jgi:hypothetical protein